MAPRIRSPATKVNYAGSQVTGQVASPASSEFKGQTQHCSGTTRNTGSRACIGETALHKGSALWKASKRNKTLPALRMHPA